MSDNKLFDNELSDNNLESELVENMTFFLNQSHQESCNFDEYPNCNRKNIASIELANEHIWCTTLP